MIVLDKSTTGTAKGALSPWFYLLYLGMLWICAWFNEGWI